MSTDQIHGVAQSDTPSKVEVPNTMSGLIVWAVGRFGGAALIAIALGYGLIRIYTDMQIQSERQFGEQKAQNAQVLEMARQATQVSADVANAMREFTKAVESNTRSVEEAHRRAQEK